MNSDEIVSDFNASSFAALRRGDICGISFDRLLGAEACLDAARSVRALTSQSSYRWSNDLSIVGVSIGEAHESEDAQERYLSGAVGTNLVVRNAIFGGATPIDLVTLEMLALWPMGVRVPTRDGRPYLQQVVRRWKQGGAANPHLDVSQTGLLAPFGIKRRFGINVYLEMPSQGGAVEFWRRDFSEEEYAGLRQPAPNYGLCRTLLGDADLKIRPRIGQAILFDASRPHAVEAVAGQGERVTVASFFGYAGDDAPLFQFA